MKKLLLLAFASSTLTFAAGCTVINKDADDAGPGPFDSGPISDSSTTPDAPVGDAPDSGTPSESGTPDTAPTPDTGPTPDGGGTAATSCSTGTLFAGNPTYDGDYLDRPTSGTGILADPPFQWQNLVFAGTNLYSRDEGEIWRVDLSAASKVETRIVGKNTVDFAYTDGTCANARLVKIGGLAALPDGSLVATDKIGNGVVKVTNPTTASCAVSYLAGNATAYTDIPDGPAPNAGDTDGVGAGAKLDGPGAIVADDAGNAYFWDGRNLKIKKIAATGTHAVTTLAKMASDGPDNVTNLVMLGGKLYLIGTSTSKAFVLSVDVGTGAVSTVLSGGGDAFPPLDSSIYPLISGLATDGSGLILSGRGNVWYLTTAGKLTLIAGKGRIIDYSSGYDPKAPHAALSLELMNSTAGSISGSTDYIGYYAGAVYYRGHGDGTAAYVEKIACP